MKVVPMPIDEVQYAAVAQHAKRSRRSARLRELAYEAIKNSILNGVLGPEAPLIEERLASVLEISRTPIREALAILEHEGLIESVPYKGLFVREVSLAQFASMYEAVEVIEPALAERAAQHATEGDIGVMDELLCRADACIPDDFVGHLAACREFDRRMGQSACIPYLTAMLIDIEERSDLYLISLKRPISSDRMQAAVTDRRGILAAVRARDPEKATHAARSHARAVRDRWRDMYVNDAMPTQLPHLDGHRQP